MQYRVFLCPLGRFVIAYTKLVLRADGSIPDITYAVSGIFVSAGEVRNNFKANRTFLNITI